MKTSSDLFIKTKVLECLPQLFFFLKLLKFIHNSATVKSCRICFSVSPSTMSFTSATFRVHKNFQTLFPAPYFIDTEISRLIPNPYFNYKIHTALRLVALTSCSLILPLVIFRIVYLFFKWTTYIKKPLDETAFHVMFVCVVLICLTNLYVVVTSNKEMQYVLSQCYKLENVQYETNKVVKFEKFTSKELRAMRFINSSICSNSVFSAAAAAGAGQHKYHTDRAPRIRRNRPQCPHRKKRTAKDRH